MISYLQQIQKEMKKENGKLFEFSNTFIESLAQDLEQLDEDINKQDNLKVYQKKKQPDEEIDAYKYPHLPEERDENECASLFYRLYYSKNDKFIQIFKDLKKRLQGFGIKFNYKKRRDEGYIIILEQFLENLLEKFYESGQSQKALQIFRNTIDSSQFEMNVSNNNAWYEFMSVFDSIISQYNNLMETPINGIVENSFNFSKIKKIIEKKENKLLAEFEDCSDNEPEKFKKEIQGEKIATLATEEVAQEFQLKQQTEKLKTLRQEDLTKLQEFQTLFGEKLKEQNSSFFDNLIVCFDYLENKKRTNDEILDHLMNNLNHNFEASLFMIENREQIVKEIKEAKEKMEQDLKQKNADRTYATISQNLIIKKKQKKSQTSLIEKKTELLGQLGLVEKMNDQEQQQKLNEEINNIIKQEQDEDEEYAFFQTDFFKETQESLKTQFRMKKTEGIFNVTFDVSPKTKNILYKQTEKLSIQDAFPEHLRPAFTDSEHLNNLQSIIHDSVFNKDENILCCAPTGAGKTNVALMSVLRLCQQHYDISTKKVGQNFKIVYISPLKALATEIVRKFQSKLNFLGISVREFTGDMQLSKKELQNTHIIVSTPEKWDVVTRKSETLNTMINLLIIDEIHLLDDERGRVLECLVARTIRLIEAKQCRIRLLGLSATLPNYKDVAKFMKVGKTGLFFFDESFRPVPLHKKFVGVKKLDQKNVQKNKDYQQMTDVLKRNVNVKDMMSINAYDLTIESLKKKHQVLVFVHSRKETFQLGEFFILRAQALGELNYFIMEGSAPGKLSKRFENKDLQLLVQKGMGAHNAGIKRKDRLGIEKAFINGQLSVVICTATLAWGINMPCHTVIIKGTDYYDPGYGFKPISLLDVQQIFGRAGRPQYDTYGEAILITKIEDLNYFVSMLNYVKPIESKLKPFLKEALLAEIVLGNICNTQEALDFVRSTFLYVRMSKNPGFYGIKNANQKDQVLLESVRQVLEELNYLRVIRYDSINQIIEPTELGRITSHFYINCQTMEKLCHYLQIYNDEDQYHKIEDISEENLIGIIAQASEFEQISTKPEEEAELNKLKKNFSWITVDEKYKTMYEVDEQEKSKGTIDPLQKILLLVWGYLNRQTYEVWSLHADTNYIIQNSLRILRSLLDIALRQNNALMTEKIVILMRYLENCVHEDSTPLRMFCFDNYLFSAKAMREQTHEISKYNFLSNAACNKLEWAQNYKEVGYLYTDLGNIREDMNLLKDLNLSDHQYNMIKEGILCFPFIDLLYDVKPIARTIMKVKLKIKIICKFNKNWHQKNEIFWIFASDGNELLYHSSIAIDMSESNLSRIQEGPITQKNSFIEHSFFVPIRESSQNYLVRVMSNSFIDSDAYCEIDLNQLQMNFEKMEYTALLDLRPLKVNVLHNPQFEMIFNKFEYFNPIQTQTFFPLYHSDENIIVGAPTGSGKTLLAELAILRVFQNDPRKKIVYIAPYKALVKERVRDWKRKFTQILNKRVEELSGDYTPDFNTLIKSDVLVTTPEKWDGVSRNWSSRSYVKNVALVIFDEIHLLGQERGPVIEVIVSRMNFIGNQMNRKVRMIGLSTAMANAEDLSAWFGVKQNFLFNFSPNVRPVPVTIHFRGFSEKNYCPRMNSMNKPAYNDIKKFGGGLPVLIFVSSRRQTRLTALDLISLSANDQLKTHFLKMSFEEVSAILPRISDQNLKNTISFGIGMHHAGLVTSDRMIVEELFEAGKIQILIATSTLAWGVNFPAKLVIIKGTEFFDPKINGYKDMPISDILQMVGRAGRPQYNDEGFACVYVEKTKKNFYRKYLNDPFPVESEFLLQIGEHLNAEIAMGSIKNKKQCVDFLTWTYFFKRIVRNPAFYGLKDREQNTVKEYLINLIDENLFELQNLKCLEIDEDKFSLFPTFLGKIANTYYIKPQSVSFLNEKLTNKLTIRKLIYILSHVEEYAEVPVRHHEPEMNMALSQQCPYKIDKREADNPKAKTYLLFQAYFANLSLPIRDYITDTKLVLDSSFRVIAAMIDICTQKGQFRNCVFLIQLLQMIIQGIWVTDSIFYNIPYMNKDVINELKNIGIQYLPQLIDQQKDGNLQNILGSLTCYKYEMIQIKKIIDVVKDVPDLDYKVKISKFDEEKKQNVAGKLESGDFAMMEVLVTKLNQSNNLNVNIKKLKKKKTQSWWLLIGNLAENTIFGVKKFVFSQKVKKDVKFVVPDLEKNPKIEVYLMSDSYIGIDQVKTINLLNVQ